EELYPSSYIAERTLAYLDDYCRSGDQRPFFLQCSFPDPHHPFTPPGRYWDMYDPAAMPLPPSFGCGDTPMLRHLRSEFARGTAARDSQLPFALDEREVREILALTYGMITLIDDCIGQITAKLRELSLDRDTVIVFMSDHGDYMGDHGIMLKGPLHY